MIVIHVHSNYIPSRHTQMRDILLGGHKRAVVIPNEATTKRFEKARDAVVRKVKKDFRVYISFDPSVGYHRWYHGQTKQPVKFEVQDKEGW